MPEHEFREYMISCFLKTAYMYNQNGIGIFENNNIKGVVGFGAVHEPYRMVADVYSKDTAIAQTIMVRSDSPEKTEEILLSILSSYTYLIEQPLDDDALNEIIVDSLGSHPLFCLKSSEDKSAIDMDN